MSGRSASALPSFHLASCSRRRPKGCRGAHSRAIDWQWRRGAYSYRLYCPPTLSCCTRPLRALGKASLVPFFLYIPISPHIVISTHCYPQEITIYTSLYTSIISNGSPRRDQHTGRCRPFASCCKGLFFGLLGSGPKDRRCLSINPPDDRTKVRLRLLPVHSRQSNPGRILHYLSCARHKSPNCYDTIDACVST